MNSEKIAPEVPDEVALSQVAQGDRDAFGILYQRYVDRIFTYIYYRTGNEAERKRLAKTHERLGQSLVLNKYQFIQYFELVNDPAHVTQESAG